jgi:predicted acylesterase/phospholipase RssA
MTKYGLVLSSDGSKSSFEIGAWKALRELDINISAVSGSFVGALNAALIAQGDFERAVRFWRNVFPKTSLMLISQLPRNIQMSGPKQIQKPLKNPSCDTSSAERRIWLP